MGLPGYANISRCEKGQRAPSIELLLVYHHLFNISIESFFELHSKAVLSSLSERIHSLINTLKNIDDLPNIPSRVRFLEQVLKRLTD
jgi:DNA-binding XRE family transcriptional regulator